MRESRVCFGIGGGLSMTVLLMFFTTNHTAVGHSTFGTFVCNWLVVYGADDAFNFWFLNLKLLIRFRPTTVLISMFAVRVRGGFLRWI